MELIKLIQFIILGVIQGFTEPLPISSSGHLVIVQELFAFQFNDLNFEIIVNFASMLAIVFLFRNDLIRLVKNFFYYLKTKQEQYKKDFIYVLLLIIAVIPAGLVGVLLKGWIESTLKSLLVVGVSLLVTGFALLFVQTKSVTNDSEEITVKDAIIIGLFQVIALVPGISRSGSTMVGGLTRKIKFEEVMRFSFLLYIPISLATMLLAVLDSTSLDSSLMIGYLAAFITSFIATYFAIKWLFNLVKKGQLKYFSYYCFVVGLSVVIASFIVG